MMLSCAYYITGRVERAGMFTRKTLDNWLMNGADPTIEGMWKLGSRDPALVDGILNMIRKAPLYQCLTVNGREFVLVHGGLGNFSPEKQLEDYGASEILWARPGPDTRYYEDKTVIFGHTPTGYLDPAYRGRAMKTDSWICIDTGAAMGGSPMLLRLEDRKEFY
jgi:serine/threonine protein phosphatase 1